MLLLLLVPLDLLSLRSCCVSVSRALLPETWEGRGGDKARERQKKEKEAQEKERSETAKERSETARDEKEEIQGH